MLSVQLTTLFVLAGTSAYAKASNPCAHDNCLRAFLGTTSAASVFCSQYIRSVSTITTNHGPGLTSLPPLSTDAHFSSRCNQDSDGKNAPMTPVALRMSSACSCLSVAPSTATVTVVSAGATTHPTSATSTASSSTTTSPPANGGIPPDAGISLTSLNLPSPPALPPGKPEYVSNSSITAELGATMEIYGDPGSHGIASIEFIDSTTGSVFVFSLDTPYTLALSTPDGEGLILQGSTVATYFDGSSQQSYVDTSPGTSKRSPPRPRDGASSITVQVSLSDSCGHALTAPYLQLDCTQLVYPQQSAAAGPVAAAVSMELLTGDGTGTYTGGCDASAELASHAAYVQCVNASRQNLDAFCGVDLDDTNSAVKFLGKIGKVVPAVKFFLTKANPALKFYNRACKVLTHPFVAAELDQESCGYPQELALGVEASGWSLALGTVTPAAGGPALVTGAQVAATTDCTTTSSSQSTPSSSSASATTATTTATSTVATAAPTYTAATTDCAASEGPGIAVYCCTGACIDGTSIGNPGQCQWWLNLCLDLQGGPPTCGADQVLYPGPDGQGVDSGDGNCWGGGECQWQRNSWTWKCCSCPSGFVSITSGQCQPGDPPQSIAEGPPYDPCVGCGPGQTLAGDATNGYYCIIS